MSTRRPLFAENCEVSIEAGRECNGVMLPMPGHRVEVFSLDGTLLGPAHVPPPVAIGDVLALVCGPPLKIVSVFHEDEEPVAISVRPLYVTTGSSPEI